MNILRKASPTKAAALAPEVPKSMPELSAPWDRADLERYRASIKVWWTDCQEALRRQAALVDDNVRQVQSDLAAEISALELQQRALQWQIAALPTQSVVETVQSAGELDSVSAEHIASDSVHGVAGVVVGTMGEQPLDAKTIGMLAPRHAQFLGVIQRSSIGSDDIVTIDSGYQMLVASPFSIYGTLTVNGTFTTV